jgi:hypothetical protein
MLALRVKPRVGLEAVQTIPNLGEHSESLLKVVKKARRKL